MKKRRFLLLSLDAAGNWPPELALVRALVRRGHDVRVISDSRHANQIEDAGAEYRPYRFALEQVIDRRVAEHPDEDEMAYVGREVFLSSRFCEELFVEVERDRPDVLLIDMMLLAVLATAEAAGLPVVNLFHTAYGAFANGVMPPGDPLLAPLNALREQFGLPSVASTSEGLRAEAIISFTYEAFDEVLENPPSELRYVGPLALAQQSRSGYELPWPPGDERPLILVSYSTSFQNQREILQRVADAVADLRARVLLTLGDAITADRLRLPSNVVAEKFVPHAAILPSASLVVTHAGHGTVMAAATAGVPMVCTPMGRDQYAISQCVERCGIGVIESATASVEELRRTIRSTLDDSELRERSRVFAEGVDLQAGMSLAIDVLENL